MAVTARVDPSKIRLDGELNAKVKVVFAVPIRRHRNLSSPVDACNESGNGDRNTSS